MHDNSLPILTGIAIVLLLMASSGQWRARNLGTLLNIGWTVIGNLSFFLNSLIWRDHSENSAPVFCDISVRFQTALQTGISASSLCITRRLAAIASSQSINVSQRRKRINLWVDLGCGIGLPIIVMCTSYIIQGRRFLIWEGYGCEFAGTSTIPTFFILLLWPLLLSATSAVYGGIAIYYFVSKRLEFRTLLKSSNSGLDTGQFIRLLCLASSDIAIAVPIDIYLIVRNASALDPFSWSAIHRDFGTVPRLPADTWLAVPELIIDVALWRYVVPMLGFILFLLIGMTEEAIGEYTRFARRVWSALPGRNRKQHLLPAPVNLGSTITRADGKGVVCDTARSPNGAAFDIVPYDSPTTPRFKNRLERVGVRVEQQIV